MNDNRQIRVAITQGDTNGIGYELIFKTFSSPEMLELCTPIIYGSAKTANIHRQTLEADINYAIITNASEAKDGRINLLNITNDNINITFGTPSEDAGRAALTAIDKAISDFNDSKIDTLVTAPINTESLKMAGQETKNQLNYIAKCFADHSKSINILVNNYIRIGMFTDNETTIDTDNEMTSEALTEKIEQLALTLKRDFRLSNPRIAILKSALATASEKDEIIKAVIEELAEKRPMHSVLTQPTLYLPTICTTTLTPFWP